MKMSLALATLMTCCAAFGQQTAEPLQFEVASIKPSEPQPMGRIRVSMDADGSMLRYSNVSLKDVIRVAFKVKDFQIDGPDWLESQRFDIVAKFPAGAKREQAPELLQSLLAERFQLKVHRDTKDHAIYAMVAGKGGPKLKPTEAPAGDQPQGARRGGPGGRGNTMMMMGPDGAHLKATGATLPNLAEMIARFADRPVVDETGIKGEYDFDLTFMPEHVRGMPGGGRGPMGPPPGAGHAPGAPAPSADAPPQAAGSIYDSVQAYGLKLESRKAPLEMLIIDHAEKAPTEN